MDPQLTTTAGAVDPIFMFLFAVCLLLLIGITAAMLYFVVRYHRTRSPQPTSTSDGNILLEVVWIALPTILVLAMFFYGWKGYLTLRTVPQGALVITAHARMWSWSFTYSNGATSSRLVVPVGKPVQVELVSHDVIHGFFLPAFRIKRDVVPGMKNHAWFVATRPGSYDLFCSSYCGIGHSAMITTVEALPAAQYAAWLRQGKGGSPEKGRQLLEKHGCLGCHSLDGSQKTGPSFKGIWLRKVTVVSSGTERIVTSDEAYLKRSILDSDSDVVKGFPPVMPSFTLTDDEVLAIVDYLRGLK